MSGFPKTRYIVYSKARGVFLGGCQGLGNAWWSNEITDWPPREAWAPAWDSKEMAERYKKHYALGYPNDVEVIEVQAPNYRTTFQQLRKCGVDVKNWDGQ